MANQAEKFQGRKSVIVEYKDLSDSGKEEEGPEQNIFHIKLQSAGNQNSSQVSKGNLQIRPKNNSYAVDDSRLSGS